MSDAIGGSLAVSGDAGTVAAGGLTDNSYIGGTWVYKVDGDGNFTQVTKTPFVGNETQGRSQQGLWNYFTSE